MSTAKLQKEKLPIYTLMSSLKLSDIQNYIEENIGTQFHSPRLNKVKDLKLSTVLKRKNPYLYKAKAIDNAGEFVTALCDATFSSSEEALFGTFLEGLARFICIQVFGSEKKSGTDAIDLEFERGGIRYFVAVKSGPNWANSQQIKRLTEAFKTIKKTLGTSGASVHAEFINGCCYGKLSPVKSNRGDYKILAGQEFWELISGSPTLYLDIIEPLGYK